MKLTQFTPGVNRNTLRAHVNPADDPAAYGASQTGAEQMNRSLGFAIATLDDIGKKRIYDNVQDALNDYKRQINTLMYDETNGLAYTMQGKAAEGLQDAYTAAEQKIRSDVMKRYGIGSGLENELFRKEADPNVNSTLTKINVLQRTGRETYAESQRVADADNTKNEILQSPTEFMTLYDSMDGRMRANYASLGMDPAAIDNAMKGVLNNMAEGTLSQMAETGSAEDILDLTPKLREKGADEATLQKYEAFARGKGLAKTTKEGAKEWLAAHQDALTLSPEEAWERFGKDHPYRAPNKADGTALGAIGNAVAKDMAAAGIEGWDPSWGTAVAAHESGRGAAAPGNNYFGYKWTGQGRYQTFQTEEVDENGNRYSTEDRFQVYDTPEDSGHAYAEWLLQNCSKDELQACRSAGDVARLMKKHGYYTDDENAYAASVEGLAKEYSGAAGTPEEQEAWEEQYKNAFLKEFDDAKKTKKEKEQSSWNQLSLNVAKMKDAGAGNAEILSYVEDAARLRPELTDMAQYYVLHESLKDVQTAAATGQSRGSGGAGKASNDEIFRLKAMISGGDIRSIDELGKAVQDSGMIISAEQFQALVDKLADQMNGKGVEIMAGKDEISKEMYGASNQIDQTQWGTAQEMTKQEAGEYYAENKRWPSQQELRSMLKKNLTKNINTGEETVSAADLRIRGIRAVTPTDDPNYRTVYFNDGSSYDVHVYELDRLMKGQITEDNLFFQRQNGMMS